MKKILFVALAALVMSFTSNNPKQAPTAPLSSNMLYYTWYWDDEGIYPTGTSGYVGQEVTRLYLLYPNYSWSGNQFGGSHQYEYGFFMYYYAEIWTNKP